MFFGGYFWFGNVGDVGNVVWGVVMYVGFV